MRDSMGTSATERMEELGIHRIGIKQKDNVVDVYMNSDARASQSNFLAWWPSAREYEKISVNKILL